MTREEFINLKVKEHYDEAKSLEHEIVGIFLQGSQNYNLDEYSEEYMSDIDTKCIILPNLDDIIAQVKPISETYVRANNEHIDIKDIRLMFQLFENQNNSYLEILFTEFKIINDKYKDLWEEVIAQANNIVVINFNKALRCLAGTSEEKYKALEHPYPGLIDKIEKFGYDPKQLHHILRVNDLMIKYIAGKPYEECLIADGKENLMSIKKGCLSLEQARIMAHTVNQENKELKNKNLKLNTINIETVNFLNDMKVKFMKRYINSIR